VPVKKWRSRYFNAYAQDGVLPHEKRGPEQVTTAKLLLRVLQLRGTPSDYPHKATGRPDHYLHEFATIAMDEDAPQEPRCALPAHQAGGG
jgi:hypothetical protein